MDRAAPSYRPALGRRGKGEGRGFERKAAKTKTQGSEWRLMPTRQSRPSKKVPPGPLSSYTCSRHISREKFRRLLSNGANNVHGICHSGFADCRGGFEEIRQGLQRRFFNKIEKLKDYPSIYGKPLRWPLAGKWEIRFEKRWRIVYTINERDKRVDIVAIWHKDEF
jgi:mRNA-degrading endonuclease RelE of RelBE toxin-antitoxin system